jgi:hypothetical protein
MSLIDEVNKSVQEEKDRRNSIEKKAYFGGMFASFLMVAIDLAYCYFVTNLAQQSANKL